MELNSAPFAYAIVVIVLIVETSTTISATLIPVKHKEGVSHGFLVLRSKNGQALATGDMIQTVAGDRVTSKIILRFKDGSIHDEVTVFSQTHEFRLISDHLRQHGPSFPDPIDTYEKTGRPRTS